MTLSVLKLYSFGDRMINKYGAVGGMRIGRGLRITRGKPQIPRDLNLDHRTRAAAVGGRRLTA
jgi:hypothetical protein